MFFNNCQFIMESLDFVSLRRMEGSNINECIEFFIR